MYYSELEARELVVKAGKRLLDTGLIARTWGNISARISRDEFIITPSGRAYDTLTVMDLVKVKVADCSYEGKVKPSSEKGIHAIAYVLRPECSFIIHTHQFFASCIGVAGMDTRTAAAAKYGLPGSDKLKSNVMDAMAKNAGKNSFLMEKHGALCLGNDYDDAFTTVFELETECKALYEKTITSEHYVADYQKNHKVLKAYIDDFAQIIGPSVDLTKPANEICSGDDQEAQFMILTKNAAAALYAEKTKSKPLSFADANLQRIVYKTKYSKLKK